MGRDQDRTSPGPMSLQHLREPLRRVFVEAVPRLVEQKDAGLVQEGARETGTTPVSLRERARPTVTHRRETELLENRLHPPRIASVQPSDEGEVLLDGQVGIESRLGPEPAELAAKRRPVLPKRVTAEDPDQTRCGSREARQDPEQRALSGSVRAGDERHGPLRYGKRDVAQCPHRTVALLDLLGLDGAHSAFPHPAQKRSPGWGARPQLQGVGPVGFSGSRVRASVRAASRRSSSRSRLRSSVESFPVS